jgi:hypothetical protein
MLKEAIASVTEKFSGALKGIEAAAKAAASGLNGLRARLQELVDEREALRSRPLPLSEAVTVMRAWIDQQSAEWRADKASLFISQFGAPPVLDARLAADGRRLGGYSTLMTFFSDARFDANALVGLLPEVVADNLQEILEIGYAQPAYTAGLPAAERAERYAAVVAEIGELESAEESIIRKARASGVKLSRRPDVQGALLSRVQNLRRLVGDLTDTVKRSEDQLANCREPEWRRQITERLEQERQRLAPVQAELSELEPVL